MLNHVLREQKSLKQIKLNAGPFKVQDYHLNVNKNRFIISHCLSELNPTFRVELNGVFIKDLEIKYVHQFQNIVFDITGKKLNIK